MSVHALHHHHDHAHHSPPPHDHQMPVQYKAKIKAGFGTNPRKSILIFYFADLAFYYLYCAPVATIHQHNFT